MPNIAERGNRATLNRMMQTNRLRGMRKKFITVLLISSGTYCDTGGGFCVNASLTKYNYASLKNNWTGGEAGRFHLAAHLHHAWPEDANHSLKDEKAEHLHLPLKGDGTALDTAGAHVKSFDEHRDGKRAGGHEEHQLHVSLDAKIRARHDACGD